MPWQSLVATTREQSLKGLIKNIVAITKELLTCCTGREASVEHNNGKVNFILNGFSDNTDTDNDFSVLLKSVHCKCTYISCNAGNGDVALTNETTWRRR